MINVIIPVLQHVNSCRAEPVNLALTPWAVCAGAAADAVLDGGCHHSLSSPAPPAWGWPVSVPPPQPAWLSLLPWLLVLRGLWTPLRQPWLQPMTDRKKVKTVIHPYSYGIHIPNKTKNYGIPHRKSHTSPTIDLPELCVSSCAPTASESCEPPPAPVWAWRTLHQSLLGAEQEGSLETPALMESAPRY